MGWKSSGTQILVLTDGAWWKMLFLLSWQMTLVSFFLHKSIAKSLNFPARKLCWNVDHHQHFSSPAACKTKLLLIPAELKKSISLFPFFLLAVIYIPQQIPVASWLLHFKHPKRETGTPKNKLCTIKYTSEKQVSYFRVRLQKTDTFITLGEKLFARAKSTYEWHFLSRHHL